MDDGTLRWTYDLKQLRDCARKYRFNSEREARRSRGAHVTPPMLVYRCDVCGGWHLGHSSWKPEGR